MEGKELKQILWNMRVNISELARKMDLPAQNIHSIFNSPDVPSGKLEAIAEALGHDMSVWYPELAQKMQVNTASGNVASTITQNNSADNAKMEMLIAENTRLVAQNQQLTTIISNLTRPNR